MKMVKIMSSSPSYTMEIGNCDMPSRQVLSTFHALSNDVVSILVNFRGDTNLGKRTVTAWS